MFWCSTVYFDKLRFYFLYHKVNAGRKLAKSSVALVEAHISTGGCFFEDALNECRLSIEKTLDEFKQNESPKVETTIANLTISQVLSKDPPEGKTKAEVALVCKNNVQHLNPSECLLKALDQLLVKSAPASKSGWYLSSFFASISHWSVWSEKIVPVFFELYVPSWFVVFELVTAVLELV